MILSTRAMLLMGLVFTLAVLFLGAHLSYLVAAVAIVAVGLRILWAWNIVPLPGRKLVRALSLVGFLTVIIFKLWGGSWGDAAVSLLVLGCALKFLELHSPRDASVLGTTIFFLSVVPFIFHYEIYMALYLAVMPILCFWYFMAINAVRTWRHEFKVLLRIVLPALPLTVLVFFGMPRPTGLWSLPQSVTAREVDVSGVSGEFSPGDVSEVVKSGELAARVIFTGPIPNIRYFKAVTYERNIGGKWYQSQESENFQRRLRYSFKPGDEYPRPQSQRGAQKYRVMAEARGTPFIPTLAGSYSPDHDVFYLNGEYYVAREPLQSLKAIDFEYPSVEAEREPSGRYLRELMGISRHENPQTWQLVTDLKNQNPDEESLARAFMAVFAQGYTYTLTPGKFGVNSTDELIFTKKQGFCGHYAQALAVMFRMAHIPARIVGGYAGGKVNGNYVILHDYDAHAWTEAYINGRWERFDAVPQLTSGQVGSEIEDMLRAEFEPKFKLTQMLASWSEYLDYHWSVWVLNFDETSRAQFFKSGRVFIVFGGVLFLTGVVILLWWWRRRRALRLAPEIELVNKFYYAAALSGHEVNSGEELKNFVARLITTYKLEGTNSATAWLEFVALFEKIRYSKHSAREHALWRRELVTKAKAAILACKSLPKEPADD